MASEIKWKKIILVDSPFKFYKLEITAQIAENSYQGFLSVYRDKIIKTSPTLTFKKSESSNNHFELIWISFEDLKQYFDKKFEEVWIFEKKESNPVNLNKSVKKQKKYKIQKTKESIWKEILEDLVWKVKSDDFNKKFNENSIKYDTVLLNKTKVEKIKNIKNNINFSENLKKLSIWLSILFPISILWNILLWKMSNTSLKKKKEELKLLLNQKEEE